MYNIAAYHAQQAVEKALKFYLREIFGEDENDHALKVHDIATLAGWLQLEYNADIPSDIYAGEQDNSDLHNLYGTERL